MNGVTVDLQLVGAVFEAVLLAHDSPRQLAELADRDEPGTDGQRDRRSEDEAPCLHAEDTVDGDTFEALDQFGDGPLKRRTVTEQWGDVTERDAGLGEVGNVPDQVANPVGIDDRVWVNCHTSRLPTQFSGGSSSGVEADG